MYLTRVSFLVSASFFFTPAVKKNRKKKEAIIIKQRLVMKFPIHLFSNLNKAG